MAEFGGQVRLVNLCLNPAMDIHVRLAKMEPGAEQQVISTSLEFGGKGVNLARYFSALSQNVFHMIAVPHDHRYIFEQQRAMFGRQVRFLPCFAPMRENITIHEADGRETRLIDHGFCFTPAEYENHLRTVAEELREHDLVIFSGRFPAGIDRRKIQHFMMTLKEQNVDFILDSKSVDYSLCRRLRPFMIKPNVEEAMHLAEGYSPELARDIAAIGDPVLRCMRLINVLFSLHLSPIIMMSAGSLGIFYREAGAAYRVVVPKIKALSTIGAGDLCLAVFISGLLQNGSHEKRKEILRRAAAGATAFCRREGSALPSMAEISEIAKQCEVKTFFC